MMFFQMSIMAWSAAVMYGALLHDIGKVVVDIEVEMKALSN